MILLIGPIYLGLLCDIFPRRTKNHQSFPARRLWHFLVKQDVLQETLIRYIFTKKRKQNEVSGTHRWYLHVFFLFLLWYSVVNVTHNPV